MGLFGFVCLGCFGFFPLISLRRKPSPALPCIAAFAANLSDKLPDPPAPVSYGLTGVDRFIFSSLLFSSLCSVWRKGERKSVAVFCFNKNKRKTRNKMQKLEIYQIFRAHP